MFYIVSAIFQPCYDGNDEYDKNDMSSSVRDYDILHQCTATLVQLHQKDV